MATRITGTGPAEMKALAARLKTADARLRRELRREFRDAADPVVTAAREEILESYSKHEGSLRAEIAATVSSSTTIAKSGVQLSIVSRGSKMPEGKGTLPAHMNDKRFSHPVYARGDRFTLSPSRARKYRGLPEAERPLVKRGAWTWVTQDSHAEGWFDKTIAGQARQLRRAAEAAMDKTRRELEG